jgi:hypothetical protein
MTTLHHPSHILLQISPPIRHLDPSCEPQSSDCFTQHQPPHTNPGPCISGSPIPPSQHLSLVIEMIASMPASPCMHHRALSWPSGSPSQGLMQGSGKQGPCSGQYTGLGTARQDSVAAEVLGSRGLDTHCSLGIHLPPAPHGPGARVTPHCRGFLLKVVATSTHWPVCLLGS